MSARSHSKWNRTLTWMLSAALIVQGGAVVSASDFGSEVSAETTEEAPEKMCIRDRVTSDARLILQPAELTVKQGTTEKITAKAWEMCRRDRNCTVWEYLEQHCPGPDVVAIQMCIRDRIPSSTLMSSIEYELFTKWQRELILKKCLQKIKDSEVYDYILIEAPPTLGGWVMNILCASDKVIIPVEASPWGMFGLANMFEFLNEVRQIAPELEVAGIAVTKVDTRKNYFKQTMETVSYTHLVSLLRCLRPHLKWIPVFICAAEEL